MIIEIVENISRMMNYYSKGCMFLDHTGQNIYYSDRKKDEKDIMLGSYRRQERPQDFVCDVLREIRDHVFVDNIRLKRGRYIRAAIGFIYETLIEECNCKYPQIKIGGKKYVRQRYEC